jgi:ABC-2 type transport system permease protein
VDTLLITELVLRRQMRDHPAVVVGLLAPILLTLVAVSALGRLTDSFHAKFLVVDQGSGVVGDLLVKGVHGDARARKAVSISQTQSLARATAQVRADKATAVFVIPRDFTRSIAVNAPESIRLVLDPADPVGGALARAVAEQFTSRLSAAQLSTAVAVNDRAAQPPPAGSPSASLKANDLALLAGRAPPALDLRDELLEGRRHRSLAGYFAPSMAVVTLLVVVQMTSRSLMEERRQGTLNRLLALRVPVPRILLGKTLAGVWMGMSTMVTTLIVVGLVTGVRWGNPVLTLVMCLATVLAFLALATLITAVSETEELASVLGVLAGTFLSLVGGNFLPLSQAPGALVRLSAFTPNGWALRGFSALQNGHAGMVDLLPSVGSLLLFTVAFGAPALVLAKARIR